MMVSDGTDDDNPRAITLNKEVVMREQAKPIGTVVLDERTTAALCEDHDNGFLGMFGSVARGEATLASDIDLLVSFRTPKSLLDLVHIERDFAERLERPVDLVTEASISPYLRDRIRSDLRPLYGRTSTR
jgi:uncharacterized protein